jgi:amino acid adenylation domain-containing protein
MRPVNGRSDDVAVSPSASFPAETSSAQAGSWFLEKAAPGSAAGTVSRVYRVTGPLDVDALRTAWSAVVNRHDALRTTLTERDGRVVAHVNPPDTASSVMDAGAGPVGARSSFVDAGAVASDQESGRRWWEARAAVPLRLADGPPARLTVAHTGADEHAIVLTVHRAAADDESLSTLLTELSAGYADRESTPSAAYVDGESTPSATYVARGNPSPTARYVDFARRQRDNASAPELLDWWTAQAGVIPTSVPLPVDRTRPPTPSDEGGVVRFEWTDTGPLTALADTAATTPAAVILTAFLTLLGRYTGTERVAVGVPVSVRPRPEFDGVIGQFNTVLPHVGDLSGRPTFRTLLGRVAEHAAAVDAHRELPFDALVRALRVDRDVRRVPLCDVMFVPAAAPAVELELAGAVVVREHLDSVPVTADLTLTITPPAATTASPVTTGAPTVDTSVPPVTSGPPAATAYLANPAGVDFVAPFTGSGVNRIGPTLSGWLSYRDCLFDRHSVELVVEQLHTLLVAALADPDLPVADLPLDGPYRLRAAVREADRIDAALQDARPAHALCHARAGRWPDAVALSWNGADITYRELERRAAIVTSALLRDGGVRDAPVVVRMATGPDQVAALLGVLDAGAHLVCLGEGNTGERGKAVLGDVRPVRMVLASESSGDSLAQWYADELDGGVLDSGELENRELDGGVPESGVPNGGVSESHPTEAETGAPLLTPVPTSLDARAYVTYTSGSTGTPKGIPQTHATFAQFVTWFAREFRIGPGSRVAQWAAPGYDASLCEVFAALAAGATLCPVPDRIRPNPEKIVDWLAEQRITVFQTVPSFARQLLRVVEDRGSADPLSDLDHLLLAGEALPGELADGLRAALPGTRLVNLYGPTESILATWHEITDPVRGTGPVPGNRPTHGTVPIGRPIPGRQVLVLDELDRPCPVGVTGHIVIRSPYLTAGYIGAAASDTFAFGTLQGREHYGIASGACYRTGDLGRRRWDGALEFRGRADFQVKFNGIRLELTDIEAALTAHESVAECAVVALTGADGLVSRLVGYVVPRRTPSGVAVAGSDVWRSALRTRFGRSMPPVSFRTMIGLPRGLGGKVDRKLLPDPGPSSADAARPTGSPGSPVAREVAAIWAELTGRAPVGQETFFAAGGHSLLALRLLDRVRERFGVAIPLPELLADPSVAGIAALVEPHTVFLQVETGT